MSNTAAEGPFEKFGGDQGRHGLLGRAFRRHAVRLTNAGSTRHGLEAVASHFKRTRRRISPGGKFRWRIERRPARMCRSTSVCNGAAAVDEAEKKNRQGDGTQGKPLGATNKHGSRTRKMRARIRHAAFTATPVWFSRGRLSRVDESKKLAIVKRDIALPELPDELDGLTIAHLTDLHIGRLTTPRHLPQIVAACQAVNADLIAVTGDFVDLSLGVLDDVIEAMRSLRAELGVYFVVGNHDYLDNGPELIRRFRDAGLRLLMNESLEVEAFGKRIAVSGIDFAHKPADLARLVHRTLVRARSRPQPDLSLLLAHHPNAFDAACRHGVDVTLSGHTHGGQLILAETSGRRGSIGLGAMSFKYPRGLYRRGPSYLYVSSGVGSWFPLRVKCPPEVASLTLRNGPVEIGETSV